MLPSPCMVMVRGELVVKKVIPYSHVERRLGQSSRDRNNATCGLRDHESCVCWVSAVCVKTLRSFHSININQCLIGQNQGYLNLNLNFAINVMKFATIIGMFPKPLKPYVAISSGSHESVLLSWSQDRCTRAI